MIKVNNARSALKHKLEPWGISTWKKINWRTVLRSTTKNMKDVCMDQE